MTAHAASGVSFHETKKLEPRCSCLEASVSVIMTSKHKRPNYHITNNTQPQPSKRTKFSSPKDPAPVSIQHPTLGLYYSRIFSLRDFLLSRLPNASKSRRRKFLDAGNAPVVQCLEDPNIPAEDTAKNHFRTGSSADSDNSLTIVLDRTLVCTNHAPSSRHFETRAKDFEVFSQHISSAAVSTLGQGVTSQSELVDFAIWLLFHRVHRNAHRPPHLLCHGYLRATNHRHVNEDHCAVAGVPGIVSHYPNGNVNVLKGAIWADILALLGKSGEEIMLDILLECSLFAMVPGGRDNYYQISGTPLTDLRPLTNAAPVENQLGTIRLTKSTTTRRLAKDEQSVLNSPAAITFVRSRMLYARPALNAKGRVTFGLRHIHALNRYSDSTSLYQTIRLMKYIFPKQFRLHNAFTSKVEHKETVQPFKDYTLREQEIAQQERKLELRPPLVQKSKQHIPKRLREEPVELVRKLQQRNSRLSYRELLEHHCSRAPRSLNMQTPAPTICRPSKPTKRPRHGRLSAGQNSTDTPSELPKTPSPATTSTIEGPNPILVNLATSQAQVSAYCRSILSRLIPDGFWGKGEARHQNKAIIMRNIDRFVKLRKFESLSLHAVSQGLKLNTISWLAPPSTTPKKMALSDMRKRREIFLEFLYYVFDSLLIPLVRSNFHVTESNIHQNRLFYFRHDVWREATEPVMANLKLSMFEEVPASKAKKMLEARMLGFSQIRLLPKANGLRPITNLRRRVTKLQNGKVALGRSINSVMTPVFNMLELEKRKQLGRIGNALFSVGDMYPKLKTFRNRLQATGAASEHLYFVKCDVKSCFDTIPQWKVVKLMEDIASEDVYRIARHAEVRSTREYHCRGDQNRKTYKPARKFISTARTATDFSKFDDFVADGRAADTRYTVFVDSIVQQAKIKEELLDLLEEHVQRNIIKVGKKFFRQKAGIPQGSVLSSLLCNFFYSELEKEHLGFLDDDNSILLRLIDDFLLITTNKNHAIRVMHILHDGVKEYGVEVNPAKSLVNFTLAINGRQLPRPPNINLFPYCGNLINTRTLEITKDRDRRRGTTLADALTVETSKTPGRIFYRKALNAFKIQTHKMFLDTNFNSPATVLLTIYENFLEAAMKYYRYIKSLTNTTQPHLHLLTSTIRDLVNLAFVLVKTKHKSARDCDYHCAVNKRQVAWLASKAFRHILGRKQSRYREVLVWLDGAIGDAMPEGGKELLMMNRIVRQGDEVFRGYKY
ncbi:MAG: hypothetical protein Q9217_006090 [Psora testacea]